MHGLEQKREQERMGDGRYKLRLAQPCAQRTEAYQKYAYVENIVVIDKMISTFIEIYINQTDLALVYVDKQIV